MKNLFNIALVFIVLVFSSCDKEERLENNLEGRWEYKNMTGGQMILGLTPDPAKSVRVLKFEGNTYQEINNSGTVIRSGTFVLLNDKEDIDGIKYSFKIDFDTPTKLDSWVKIFGKTLKLSIGSIALDGTTETFTKLQ